MRPVTGSRIRLPQGAGGQMSGRPPPAVVLIHPKRCAFRHFLPILIYETFRGLFGNVRWNDRPGPPDARFRAGPARPRARSARIVPAAPLPSSLTRNFDSLLAVKIPWKPKSCAITPPRARAPRHHCAQGPHGHRAPLKTTAYRAAGAGTRHVRWTLPSGRTHTTRPTVCDAQLPPCRTPA
jgi:hypothetical protein